MEARLRLQLMDKFPFFQNERQNSSEIKFPRSLQIFYIELVDKISGK